MEIADNYQREYGFMALNAVLRNAVMLHKVHDVISVEELRLVELELVKRGVKVVGSQGEYDKMLAEHGVPQAFHDSSISLPKLEGWCLKHNHHVKWAFANVCISVPLFLLCAVLRNWLAAVGVLANFFGSFSRLCRELDLEKKS